MIRNDAVLNEELDPRLMIEKLRREIQQLKDELSLATGEQRTDSLTDDDISRWIQLTGDNITYLFNDRAIEQSATCCHFSQLTPVFQKTAENFSFQELIS